jgi:peptidoglycan LD-endopeptidase CwlK
MKHHKFSQRSLDRLQGVNPSLVEVAHRALELSKYDFGITEGLRTIERQKELVNQGASQTMNSKHIDGNAIDIGVYVESGLTWEIQYYRKVAQAFFTAAIELGVQIEWGGLWESFLDGPHFQIKGD